jgi:hypothetical protein
MPPMDLGFDMQDLPEWVSFPTQIYRGMFSIDTAYFQHLLDERPE